jgi:hypothetical protein
MALAKDASNVLPAGLVTEIFDIGDATFEAFPSSISSRVLERGMG